MIVLCTNQCAYCRFSIVSGQRWVREKIYDPALNGREPSYHRYHRYHVEPFAGHEGSCWEKHQMEQDIARTTPALTGRSEQLETKHVLVFILTFSGRTAAESPFCLLWRKT
jgi:hypothetical protein